MAEEKQALDPRSSIWTFIIYPGDSAPEDWEDKVKSWNIPGFISPLHVPDQEAAKPHRHVMLIFGTLKSVKQVKQFASELNGTQPFIVHDKAGYSRYLIHLDSPDKQQWTPEQLAEDPVICLAGMNYNTFLLDTEDPFNVIKEIEAWIEEKDLFSLWEVIRYSRENNDLWYRVLHKRTIAIDLYLKSRLWSKTKQPEALYAYQKAKELEEEAAAAGTDPELVEES